jgi:hypothetical protein
MLESALNVWLFLSKSRRFLHEAVLFWRVKASP